MSGHAPLVLIAAVARNGVIGTDNRLPWHLPEDLRHFKAVTLGHPIVMGRKTWESLGRPLPGRRNLVISRNPDYAAAGAEVFPGLEAALAACPADAPAFLIGGAELYRLGLPLADEMRLTEVDLDVAGDAHFPDFDRDAWTELAREPKVSANGIGFAFVTYRRR
jgi:dihydrofolate reductase